MAIDHDSHVLVRARALVEAAMREPQAWSAHLAQAESLLMAAAVSAPDDSAVLTCLGAALCDQGKYREAAEALQRAVRLGSDDRNTYFNLGVALLNSGGRRQAMQHFRQAASRRASAATWEAYFDPHAQ